jgi:hypothetical protein
LYQKYDFILFYLHRNLNNQIFKIMSWIIRVTALKDQWGNSIKKGETFTLVQSSSQPSSLELKNLITKAGRKVTTNSSLPTMGSNEQIKEMNGWLVEKIK